MITRLRTIFFGENFHITLPFFLMKLRYCKRSTAISASWINPATGGRVWNHTICNRIWGQGFIPVVVRLKFQKRSTLKFVSELMKLRYCKRSTAISASWINPATGGGYHRYPWLMKLRYCRAWHGNICYWINPAIGGGYHRIPVVNETQILQTQYSNICQSN